jgi:DNA invertase Pin-like site-specific DNA recombinase
MLIGFGRRQLTGDREDDTERLKALECERVFIYETSQELNDRFDEMIDFCRAGDVVALVDLDRLGSSLTQVLSAIEQMDDRGVRIAVRETGLEPGTALGDNFPKACRLLRTLAPREEYSERIRRRGRPAVLDDSTQEKALRLLSGNASVLEVARLLRVSPATIYRYFPRRSRTNRNDKRA